VKAGGWGRKRKSGGRRGRSKKSGSRSPSVIHDIPYLFYLPKGRQSREREKR
jgi:hypothetical protein